jgi:hypothetical protein
MDYKILVLIKLLLITNISFSQEDLIFKSGFSLISKLNDTGITWLATATGNKTHCSNELPWIQDCFQGRDNTHNDDSDGHAGFSFTKIDGEGSPLPSSASTWSCVKDNVTGLMWEVKNDYGGIHDKDNNYQWGGVTAIGRDHPNKKGVYYEPSWNELVNGSNNANYCGRNNWRLPMALELSSITNKAIRNPAVDLNYFPNTFLVHYWTAEPDAFVDYTSHTIHFRYGADQTRHRDADAKVRLVSSEF